MIKTKAQAKKVAKEWQTLFVDFYNWNDDVETSVDDDAVIIKEKNAGVFYRADSVAEFCKGRRLDWYITTDDKGYLYARIY